MFHLTIAYHGLGTEPNACRNLPTNVAVFGLSAERSFLFVPAATLVRRCHGIRECCICLDQVGDVDHMSNVRRPELLQCPYSHVFSFLCSHHHQDTMRSAYKTLWRQQSATKATGSVQCAPHSSSVPVPSSSGAGHRGTASSRSCHDAADRVAKAAGDGFCASIFTL